MSVVVAIVVVVTTIINQHLQTNIHNINPYCFLCPIQVTSQNSVDPFLADCLQT